MYLRNLRDSLVRFLSWSGYKDVPSNSTRELSEKSRLLHRLNCIDLNDEEVKCLQGYLTTILEARQQEESSDFAASAQSGCMVLEMDEEEFREFTSHVGGNGTRLFRAIVQRDNSKTPARKLAVVGENGLRLFHLLVQSRDSLLQK